MKITGIITEYNPLHNGHIHHINEAVRLTNCDVLIAIMSGDFVQRGEPALLSKYIRSKTAVSSGVNLVIELPVKASLSSAENFADVAIRTLAALSVDTIVFGSECGDVKVLYDIAQLLLEEPDKFRVGLQANLKKGLSYPAARANAISSTLGLTANLCSEPNNVLGIEYIKAILKHRLNISALTINRTDKGYNSKDTSGEYISASAVRAFIQEGSNKLTALYDSVPNYTYQELAEHIKECIFIDDYYPMLMYRLESICYECNNSKESFCEYLSQYDDFSTELSNKIFNVYTSGTHTTMREFLELCKTKNITMSRIKRCLMRLLLNIKDTEVNNVYCKILGIDSVGRAYINSIRKDCHIPIITKVADYKKLLYTDIHASRIYNQLLTSKTGISSDDDYKRHIYIHNKTKA